MKTYLKIKAKSLAAESRIIRQEERRNKVRYERVPTPNQHNGRTVYTRGRKIRKGNPALLKALQDHRLEVVRPEARATHLAYGFLRGRDYRQIEAKVREDNAPDWDRVAQLVAKYGDMDRRDAAQKLAEWSEAA